VWHRLFRVRDSWPCFEFQLKYSSGFLHGAVVIRVSSYTMSKFKVKCPVCSKAFPTTSSLEKHSRTKDHQYQSNQLSFYDSHDHAVKLPSHCPVSTSRNNEYIEFIGGVAELLNSWQNPQLKQKWLKVDLWMVPNEYFSQMLYDLKLEKPFSVRDARHPSPLSSVTTRRLSYNTYQEERLKDLFSDSAVQIKVKTYFKGLTEVPPPHREHDSAREKLARARARAGKRWGAVQDSTEDDVRPDCRRQVLCNRGIGRKTREFQLIWWPNVY